MQSKDLNVNNLTAYAVSTETLAGRNYRHYLRAVKDTAQPLCRCLNDLELQDEPGAGEETEPGDGTIPGPGESADTVDESAPEEWGLPEEPDTEETARLCDLLPDECYVKRFADDYSTGTCWLMYLVTDTKGNITDSGCLREDAHRCTGSGEWLGVPGLERPVEKVWSYASQPPEKVTDDLRLLFRKQALPMDFSLIGRPLPKKLKESLRPGDRQCVFALPSALRQAFSHMTADIDGDGRIQALSLATWQRSGSSFGDLFYQPMNLADRQEEAMNALLYLYDSYSAQEKQLF